MTGSASRRWKSASRSRRAAVTSRSGKKSRFADDDRQSRFRHRPVIHLRANTPKVVGVLRRDQLTINRLFFRRAGRSTGDVPVRLIRGARHERRSLQHSSPQRSRLDGGNRVRACRRRPRRRRRSGRRAQRRGGVKCHGVVSREQVKTGKAPRFPPERVGFELCQPTVRRDGGSE